MIREKRQNPVGSKGEEVLARAGRGCRTSLLGQDTALPLDVITLPRAASVPQAAAVICAPANIAVRLLSAAANLRRFVAHVQRESGFRDRLECYVRWHTYVLGFFPILAYPVRA